MSGVPQRPQLKWSHFKAKYSGKPEEDTEAHLLRTNNWMDTHDFLDHVKVQRFCLTLVGKARLWYESLRPINADWEELQHMFRQQYSKIGNTREQLFHAWRSFYFNVVEAWYSLEQYIGLKEDKLSSTTVDFIRSEGNLETKCLYWFSKPKMC